jgi:ATP-dependent helicase/nuclease subunit B
MIKLFTSNTTRGATGAVIEEIKRNYSIGVNQIILTPDSYKFTIEKEIFNALELDGSFDIEVTTFARLAQSILKHKAKKCLSKEGAVLLLRNVIAHNKDKLLHYGAVANNPRFAHEIFAVIASIRNNGYTANDLERILPNLAKGTKTKTHDFALLFREYENALTGKYADATYMVDALMEKIPTSKKIRDSHIYAIAYDKFTGQQLKVLELLAKYGRSLSVGVTPNNRGSNAHLYPWETGEAIKSMPIKVENMDYVFEAIKEPFSTLNKRMFSYTQIPNKLPCNGKIHISRENNVYEEFNGIAHEIARLVRREGVRYNEISIINLNPDYNNELSSILARYDIPHFVSLKYSLGNTIIAKFIKEYFEVIVFNKRADKVVAFMKDPLFQGDVDCVCEFEN